MRADRYKHLFTKELLMGPNAVRLLDELLEDSPIEGGRVLDLGCGTALTSLFMAKETAAEQIFAVDLWIPATPNWQRIKAWGMEHKIIPLHADANELPFPDDFFDVVVSVDSYHYYGCKERFFADKILPLIRKGGKALFIVPGLKKEFESGNIPAIMTEWAGDETSSFHDAGWWKNHIAKSCEDRIEIEVYESGQFEQSWREWIDTGHEFAATDKEFLDRGLDRLLNFVNMIVRVK